MIKTAKHPSGLTIKFKESDHSYVCVETGQKFTSATTFVSSFFPKFDAVEVSERIAEKRGTTPEALRAEWEAEGNRGRTEGTNCHAYAEAVMQPGKIDPPAPLSERCSRVFKSIDWAAGYLLDRYQFVAAEKMIFSPLFGLSGTIDLLMHDPRRNHLLILDWKQNKEIGTTNRWQSGFPPIGHLEDTDFNHYTLQLSTYKTILLTENYFAGIDGIRLGLIHVTPEEARFMKLDYYGAEIAQMIHQHRKGRS